MALPPYLLHDVTVAITGDASVLEQRLEGRLRLLPSSTARRADITFDLGLSAQPRASLPRPSGAARPVYEHPVGEYAYFVKTDELYFDHAGIAVAHCQPAIGLTRIRAIARSDAIQVAVHVMFTLPLIETLKRRGLFGVHAAGVAVDGRAVLFPGASGAGKSTLALVCARAGMALLGDDLVFLRTDAHGPSILGFPDEVDVTQATTRLLPEISPLVPDAVSAADTKRPIRPETIARDIASRCEPAMLAFPRVTHAARSSLRPISADEAATALVPNVLMTERRASQSHLDALIELAKSCRSFQFDVGRDIDEQPALLLGALAG
jgi:hypothetical protein